ncbi:hypothetical protein KIM67_13690 [Flagellimonas sp. 389]|nr:hypothetical protein [Flagellimonas sp. 389]
MRILVSFFIITISLQSYGQYKSIGEDEKKIFESTAPESIFVHYNSSFYMVGEYMYFKIYCLNPKTKRLSHISKMAYLELIDKSGERVFRQKIKLDNGIGQGDFFLPVGTPSGNYKLVAYTKWMGNWGQGLFSQEDIAIINPYSNNQKNFLESDSIQSKIDSKTSKAPSFGLGENPMKMAPTKKQFGKREAVTIKFEGKRSEKIPNGAYSISVRRYDPIFPNHKKTTFDHLALTKISTPIFEKNFILPELRGELITGKVVTNNPDKPVGNLKVSFSIPGENYQLKIARTDASGQFYFNIGKPYRSEEAVIQILEEKVDGLTVEIENPPTLVDVNDLKFKSFKLNPDMNDLILKQSIQNQIENAYFKVKPDTIVSEGGQLNFYGKKAKTYLLDDYTRFPTVKETVLEILNNVWLMQTKDGAYSFNLRTLNGEFNNSEFTSLLLVDGLLVKDQDYFIKNFNSNLIERINIVRQYYRIGSQIFDGVIDIQTFDLNYQIPPNKDGLKALKLDRQTEIKDYFRQTYVDSTIKQSKRIPDLRQQLLWLPNIDLDKDETITFFTSDVSGNFEISLEGFTETGQPVSLKETITVE